ncbi:Protein S-acyltransferase [Ascochyta rabiei]|uniref:Metal ion binding n=1 Tax=Didymella rabiei TaxID=5454 RepID=A0A163F8W2_DIDRA|nr:Protein S-acyltransferase [Ascochyta rabiei]KZM24205.1 metal ion binding [Ascochyta rabiei]UPX17400.1 Protein S-acyltransferase [Ascochyta rabiei]
MPAIVEPDRVKCTYVDCNLLFANETDMKRHKKHSDGHDYCHKCDEDFESYEDLAQHKIFRPDTHNKACRVCGQEFKSESGLRRHIELVGEHVHADDDSTDYLQTHKIDQKLTCIGCNKSFYRACLFIEHLEFGYCEVISASQFQGHIVHKHLVTALLKDSSAYDRFKAKQAKYDAATGDFEEEGGVCLDDPLDRDEEIEDVNFAALQPEVSNAPLPQSAAGPFPPLRTHSQASSYDIFEVASTIGAMSVNGDNDTSAIVGHRSSAPHSAYGSSTYAASTSTGRQLKVWGGRNGKSASSTLFPNAKSTPATKEFSIAAHDEQMERDHGINIMRTRFWDPLSSDWNPERFYDSVINKYNCPFVCELTFETPADLNKHINGDHRLTRMKCPMCLKYFKSATALMAHCESRGAKCLINKSDNFTLFLDRMSGGFLGVKEKVRPDHLNNPTVLLTDPETGRVERYKPPVASYLQYMVTQPPDWKEPSRAGVQIGFAMQQGQW